MPAYDYRCQSCGHTFEKTQRITAPAGAACPSCSSEDCTRLITGGTFHLKGSGWYQSDYGKSGGANSSKPSEPAACGVAGGCSSGTCPMAEA
jgi:putative FmdB family regulatory protein